MVLQLRQLFDIPGQVLEIDESVPKSEYEESALYESFAEPVKLKGRVKNSSGVVTLDYTITALLSQCCDRCLKAFEREYEYSFSHTLVTVLENEDDAYDNYIVCPDKTLDLSELALSDLLLSMPTKILCKEDCKGLCMKCGKNLNDGECDCSE